MMKDAFTKTTEVAQYLALFAGTTQLTADQQKLVDDSFKDYISRYDYSNRKQEWIVYPPPPYSGLRGRV